jgi:hypothetical protein
MTYSEEIFFQCYLQFKDPNFIKVKKLIVSILGQSQEAGKLHHFIAVLDKNGEKLKGEAYQLKLTPKQLVRLQEKCMELNISFEDVFERDWRHFHLNFYKGNDEHEGTAYEHEDYWEIFYEVGSLSENEKLRENNFFILKVNKRDITNLNEIESLFEGWVLENIG